MIKPYPYEKLNNWLDENIDMVVEKSKKKEFIDCPEDVLEEVYIFTKNRLKEMNIDKFIFEDMLQEYVMFFCYDLFKNYNKDVYNQSPLTFARNKLIRKHQIDSGKYRKKEKKECDPSMFLKVQSDFLYSEQRTPYEDYLNERIINRIKENYPVLYQSFFESKPLKEIEQERNINSDLAKKRFSKEFRKINSRKNSNVLLQDLMESVNLK